MRDRLQDSCMITQDSFIRFMHENVPKSCTHMHDLRQVSCMNLAKIHSMIMQEFFAWVESLADDVACWVKLTFHILEDLVQREGVNILGDCCEARLLKSLKFTRD